MRSSTPPSISSTPARNSLAGLRRALRQPSRTSGATKQAISSQNIRRPPASASKAVAERAAHDQVAEAHHEIDREHAEHDLGHRRQQVHLDRAAVSRSTRQQDSNSTTAIAHA